jgi:hypothetical protein
LAVDDSAIAGGWRLDAGLSSARIGRLADRTAIAVFGDLRRMATGAVRHRNVSWRATYATATVRVSASRQIIRRRLAGIAAWLLSRRTAGAVRSHLSNKATRATLGEFVTAGAALALRAKRAGAARLTTRNVLVDLLAVTAEIADQDFARAALSELQDC